MSRQLYAGWRDELATLAYPFTEESNPRTFGGRELPMDCVLDVIVHPPGQTSVYFLAKIELGTHQARASFGDVSGNVTISGVIRYQGENNDAVQLYTVGQRRAGVMTVSPDAWVKIRDDWGEGAFDFSRQNSQLVASCCLPVYGANPIAPVGGVAISPVEELYLVGERGVRLSCSQTSESQGIIDINVVGDPMFADLTCEDLTPPPRPIETVVFQSAELRHECPVGEKGQVEIAITSAEGKKSALRLQRSEGDLRFSFFSKAK